jgi:hypothetical protein
MAGHAFGRQTGTGSTANRQNERQGTTLMIEEKLARLQAHRNNIYRYRRLFKTPLTDLERQYLERRLGEEQAAIEMLSASAGLGVVAHDRLAVGSR